MVLTLLLTFEHSSGTGCNRASGSKWCRKIHLLQNYSWPHSGYIWRRHVLGHDIRTEGLAIRSKIGYMPEYDALDDDMDAIHQVRYSGELLGNESSGCDGKGTHCHGICRTWRIALSSNFVIFNRYEASNKVGLFNHS